jgi:hypothetical protein
MTQRIEVPGMGIVEFPDSMNDDQIAAAIKQNMAQQPPAAPKQESMFSATGLPAKAMGAFETGLSTLSGLAAVPASAAAGIYGTLTSGKYGTQEGIRTGDALARQVQEKMTYRPTTEKGQEYVQNVGQAFEASKIPPIMAGPMGMVGLGGAGGNTIPNATRYAAGRAVNIPKQTYTGFTGSLGSAENRLIAKPGTLEADIPVYQRPSALEPAGNQYIPDPVLQQMRNQQITPEQALQGMENWNPAQKAALERTKGMVPLADQKWQGVGEILAQPYQSWKTALPSLLANVGVPGLAGLYAGGPVGAALGVLGKIGLNTAQAIRTGNKIRGANELENVGFTRMTDAERAALAQAQKNPQPLSPGPMPTGGTPPQTPPPAGGMPQTPPPGPAPMGGAPSMAAQTPAAQAAAATTQAKVQQTTGAAVPQAEPPIPQPKPQAAAAPAVEPVPLEKWEQQRLPHKNTPVIEQALQEKIATDPNLAGFDKNYVVPSTLRQPVNDFVTGKTPNIVAYGGPGTGKTSMAGEWLAKNPGGKVVYLDSNSFNAKRASGLIESNKTAPGKTLYIIDEADKFGKKISAETGAETSNPAQLRNLAKLKDNTANSVFLATTNDIKNIPEMLKPGKGFTSVNVDHPLTPAERQTFALNIAKKFNVDKTPAEIQAIADNPALKSFRDIKNAVSEGYSLKRPPSFGNAPLKGRVDLPDQLTTLIDNFNDNATSKNVLIFDKSAFKADPKLSEKLNKAHPITSMTDADIIPEMMIKGSATSPTYRVVIRTKEDARQLSSWKGTLERSNEYELPTRLIIEDQYGLLDPAIHSRAEMVDKSYFTKPAVNAKAVDVAKAIQRGEDLGIVKSPKTQPEVKYNHPWEMRRALTGTMPTEQLEALIKKTFPK